MKADNSALRESRVALADLIQSKATSLFGGSVRERTEGRRLWDRTFGTNKEEQGRSVIAGAEQGWSKSATHDASVKRLLQALRSMAPGGWSDDRWEQTRHFVGITYVAVHRICTQLQQSEFQVFVKDSKHPDGKRPVTEDDPPHGDRVVKPYDLVRLLESPNDQDSFGKLMYRWGQQKHLTGTALTWLVPNKLGTPMEMYSIPTSIAVPQPAVNPDFPDGFYRIQPVYPYGPFSSYPTPASAVGAPISAKWMLRFQYPHPLLRYEGYAPTTGMRHHIDQHESIDRSRWYSMKRQVRPDAVLNMKEVEGFNGFSEDQVRRVQAEFEAEMMGPENAGRLFIPFPGAELEPWGANPREMEYQQGWEQIASFILGGGFGITKPAAGMIEESSYSTLYAALKQLNLIVLDPECDDIASELTRKLAPYFGDNLIIEIRCKRIDDHEVQGGKIDKILSLKGSPKSVIRLCLNLLDVPASDELIEDLEKSSEEGQQGMGIPGMEGMGPGQEGAGEEEDVGLGLLDEATAEMDEATGQEEIEESRPQPGNLGRGALGPRMKRFSINGHRKKSLSFYDQVRRACKNGHN